MEKVQISGRLGRDAAIRETQSGAKIISFTVAVNSKRRNVEKTSWYDVSIFNYERYKNMAQYLTKGSLVYVAGDIETDLETGNDGITRCRRNVLADSVEFINSGASGNTNNNVTKASDGNGSESNDSSVEDMPRRNAQKPKTKVDPTPNNEDEDLPF